MVDTRGTSVADGALGAIGALGALGEVGAAQAVLSTAHDSANGSARARSDAARVLNKAVISMSVPR